MFAFATSFASAQEVDGLYYSDLMVKDGTFTWNVTQSDQFYETIDVGVNFTVTLKDDLYPGPISEEDLEKVYASVKVDGDKYTGEGFPLFWHLYKISNEGADNVTIREEFEAETDLFNVTDGGSTEMFNVNFTIEETGNVLYVDMDINSTIGITTRYYEYFYNNGTNTTSIIELSYLYGAYTLDAPFNGLWALAGVFTIGALVVIRKRKQKK